MAARKLTRRSFVARSATIATSSVALPNILNAATRKKELHIAAIGVNGMGWSDLSSIGSHASVQFMGFCDIDSSRFDKADAAFKNVPHYSDYRVLLSELANRIDAVIVATPDHMHAPIALAAMKLGKHVYCQKPLTHTVWEARQMQLMAGKMKLTTQMGNQIHSAQVYRQGVQLIKDGAIGKVTEVHSWIGVQGRQYCNRTDRPAAGLAPSTVDWDLWLGSAPVRPFAPDVYHPFKWRDWQDFGSGALGDFGCHILDPVFCALGIKSPTSIVAENAGTNAEVWPGPETVTYEFPGTERTANSSIKVVWRDGGLKPPRELAQLPDGVQLPGGGSLFIGEGGVMVLPHVGKPSLYAQQKALNIAMPDINGTNHWHDWVDAVIAGTQTTDGFDYAGPLTETVQLGNIAARLPGQKLHWDSQRLKITNVQEANRFLTKNYRAGFEVEAVS